MVYVYKLSKYQNIKTLEQGPALVFPTRFLPLPVNRLFGPPITV
jgi:hypothetical protein